MKKIQLISILIVVLLFSITAYAGTQKMKLVGSPKVRVEHTPRVVSAYAVFEIGSTEPQTVLTVPDGKTFILTDIYSERGDVFQIYENTILKTRVYTHDRSIHFRTGIPFSSGSDIIMENENNAGIRDITITGYLLKD